VDIAWDIAERGLLFMTTFNPSAWESSQWFIFVLCGIILLGFFGILASQPSKKPIQKPPVSNRIRRPPKLFTLEV